MTVTLLLVSATTAAAASLLMSLLVGFRTAFYVLYVSDVGVGAILVGMMKVKKKSETHAFLKNYRIKMDLTYILLEGKNC